MTYHLSGLGADEWKNVSGVCRPMDNASLGLFKELQNQLNRVAIMKKWSRIDVDGRIGSRTVDLYNKSEALSVLLGPVSGCDQLAQLTVSGQAVAGIKRVADSLNAPTSVPAPWTSRPSQPSPSGGPPVDPPAAGVTDMLSGTLMSPIGLVLLAGAGFLGFRALRGKKKGGRRISPLRVRARARRIRRSRSRR